jgi:hypothetical protein
MVTPTFDYLENDLFMHIHQLGDIEGLSGALVFKGSIDSSDDFPTSAEVETGWFYIITADVTDDDPTKTNTGQSFLEGDEIVWNGSDWTNIGSIIQSVSFGNEGEIPFTNSAGDDFNYHSSLIFEEDTGISLLTVENSQSMILANGTDAYQPSILRVANNDMGLGIWAFPSSMGTPYVEGRQYILLDTASNGLAFSDQDGGNSFDFLFGGLTESHKYYELSSSALTFYNDADLKINSDTGKIYLGAGDDFSIEFDGTAPVLDGISTATVATDDKVLINDTSDSDRLKTVTAQSIADLASGASPGGSDTQLQYNDGGSFGGISVFTWDDTDLLVGTTTKLQFRDSAIHIQSADDGHLDLTADTSIDLNGNVVVTGDIEVNQHATFDAEYDNGNSSTADTIDWGNGNYQKSTLTDNCTFTFTAPDGVGKFQLKLIQDGTGSRTVTFPGTVKWESGTAPTLTTDADAIDIIVFYFDGTNYYGGALLDFQ